jgi:hypothetical protein
MDKEVHEKINTLIDKAIQNELSYQKDYITNDAWQFLEEKASDLILKKIAENDMNEEEIAEIKLEDIETYLADVISEYEENHPPIRMNSLWK